MKIQRVLARLREVAFNGKFPAGTAVWATINGKLTKCIVVTEPLHPAGMYTLKLADVRGKDLLKSYNVPEDRIKPLIHTSVQ